MIHVDHGQKGTVFIMKHLKKFGALILTVTLLISAFCVTANAKQSDMSAAFNRVLNGGQLVFNSVPPVDENDQTFYSALDDFMLENPDFSVNIVGNSTSKIKLILNYGQENEEAHVVDIVWRHTPKVWEKAKEIAKKLPGSGTTVNLTDMELVNYWAYYKPDSPRQTLVNYSGELKAILENTNFTLASQKHGGMSAPFVTFCGGPATLRHNKTTYYAIGAISARADHVIYIPENTANDKTALAAAAQKRIDDYIGKNVIKVTATNETVTGYYNGELADYDRRLAEAEEELPKITAALNAENAKPENQRDQSLIDQYAGKVFDYEQIIENTAQWKQEFMDDFAEGGYFHFLKKAEGDFIFEAKVSDRTFKFIVMKDDDKLTAPTYTSVDFETQVSVSTDSAEVPLDTVVEVDRLTDGEEYDRICKAIEADDNETYDIRLHSDTLDNRVTKLANGKFLVRIPVPERFKGKRLHILYVDADNRVTEHSATEKDGYACFETDHFSIYTLAVGDGIKSDITYENNAQSGVTDGSGNEGGSNLILWIVIGVVLAAGAAVTVVFIVKKKKLK